MSLYLAVRNIENCVSKWPIDFCKFKILPELVQSLEFGGAGAKALKPIITIGSRLGQKEFEELVTPAIIKLFNSNDRGIRLALCEKIESYINQISEKVCNDTIYPCLVRTFRPIYFSRRPALSIQSLSYENRR